MKLCVSGWDHEGKGMRLRSGSMWEQGVSGKQPNGMQRAGIATDRGMGLGDCHSLPLSRLLPLRTSLVPRPPHH